VAAYTYDALDRLRTVERGGARIRFRYAGTSTAVAQVVDDITGTVIRNVAAGPDGTVLEDWLGTSRRLYGTNGHHDTTWTADDTGAVTATLRADPWGTLLRSSGSLPDWRFQGSWYDTSTDLSWAVARWYAPTLGAFIGEDSLLGEPEQPASRHLLAYAEGDPVDGWDPTGRAVLPGDYWRHQTALLVSWAFAVASCQGTRSVVTAHGLSGIPASKIGTLWPDLVRKTGNTWWIWEVKPWSDYGRFTGPPQLAKYIAAAKRTGVPTVLKGYWLASFFWPDLRRAGQWVAVWSGSGRYAGIRFYQAFSTPLFPRTVPVNVRTPVRVPAPAAAPDWVIWVGGGVVAAWWLLKLFAPACGPLAPACAALF